MTFHRNLRLALAGAAALSAAVLPATVLPVSAAEISGAGATFPYPIYAKWAEAYQKTSGVQLNYQAIGSGAGIKQIKARTVTFGASDMPLKQDELKKDGLVQWPMVMGGIVPVVNIEGVQPGQLVLDGPTLAKIFLGEIKSWDDPAIAKLNSGVKLPSAGIAVVANGSPAQVASVPAGTRHDAPHAASGAHIGTDVARGGFGRNGSRAP